MSHRKTLAERLADISSDVRSVEIDPEAPVFDDGTAAGRLGYRNDDDISDEVEGSSHPRPSASLRTAADMEMIGHEYQGKRVSRKDLNPNVSPRESQAVDTVSDDGEHSSDGQEVDEVDDDGPGAGVPSLDLDDISSSSEEDEGHGEDDGRDGGQYGHEVASDEEDGDSTAEGDEGSMEGRPRKKRGRSDDGSTAQANVFESVNSKGIDAMVEEQISQLYRQDEKANKGRGVAGKRELERAREALSIERLHVSSRSRSNTRSLCSTRYIRQQQWWDSLLEVRILLQRLLNVANRLPGPDELQLLLDGDDALGALATQGATAARNLSKQLSKSRRSHMSCWGIQDGDQDGTGTGDHASREGISHGGVTAPGNKRKTGSERDSSGSECEGKEEREAVASREHARCMAWWEAVIGRWHERTQTVNPSLQRKFKVVNQGPWAQVTASLADRQRASRKMFMRQAETDQFLGRRLAKRLKAKRQGVDKTTDVASARVPGHEEQDRKVGGVLGKERRSDEEDPLDLEVLDDRELYQHLLKEFMESSAGSAGGASSGVALRRKSRKRSVDRRASKGRKIKYVTHPKMQNFMFSQEYPPPPMEPSELFPSLFGGAVFPAQSAGYESAMA